MVNKIVDSAKRVVNQMNQIAPNPEQGKLGGVMVIAKVGENPFMVAQKVGKIDIKNPSAENELDKDKVNKYFMYAFSKAATVIQNQDFHSSRENMVLPTEEQLTVDGKNTVPGGAIKFGDYVVSFSGYSMEDDEAVVLASVVDSGGITDSQSFEIASQVGCLNRYVDVFDKLFD